MRKLPLVSLVLLIAGCAGAYRSSYIAGATANTFVTEAHALYDTQAQAKLAICDPERNPQSTVKTQSDFDECMTKPFEVATQEAIVQALAIYRATAVGFSAVMLGCEPADAVAIPDPATCVKRVFTDAELRAWRSKLIAASLEALKLFPDADAKVRKLQTLIGR